jgi:N-acyl-D-aspartate/D-glutamate deacylase
MSFLFGIPAPGSPWSPLLVELGAHNVEQARLTLVAAHGAGVRVAMGYDSSPLRSATNELLAMIDFGLPAEQALVAATAGSAEALGLAAHIGTVETGKLADLLVADGDQGTEPRVLTGCAQAQGHALRPRPNLARSAAGEARSRHGSRSPLRRALRRGRRRGRAPSPRGRGRGRCR